VSKHTREVWATIDKASRDFLVRSFAQRRARIEKAIWQLRQDVDSWNENHRPDGVAPIMFIHDFSEDIAERYAWLKRRS